MQADDDDSDEIPVELAEEPVQKAECDDGQHDTQNKDESCADVLVKLEREKARSADLEDQLKHTMADFQNLERKTRSDIESGVNARVDKLMLDFLQIYDDFGRARSVAAETKAITDGLDSILKNMDSLLSRYGVTPIESVGEIFDPKLHEAVSVIHDAMLDDGTITKEIRKGYISQQRVIRPTLVEISKKSESDIAGKV